MPADQRSSAGRLRSTRQRAAIISALRRASGFKTAQGLHLEMAKAGEGVALATIYRNLQALADSGEVDVLQSELGEAMFCLCQSKDHHHHLVCRRCGRSEEIRGEEVESWATDVGRAHGFSQVSHTVEVFGVCRECSE